MLNLSEATAVNTLLNHVLRHAPEGQRISTGEDAASAARLLAGAAHKKLAAGITPNVVDALWEARRGE